jgi:DNA gyrase/topoisomerase IV subunit B
MKKIRNKPAIVNSSDSEEESNFEGQKKRKLSQSRRDKSRSERCMEKMLKKLEKQ